MSKDYKQYDSRWGSKAYCGSTMTKAGCGPTACADIMANSKDVDPWDAACWMKQHGYTTNGSGTVWSGIAAYFNKNGVEAEQLNGSSLYGKKESEAESKWKKGMKSGDYYGILLMGPGMWTGSGHYIAITSFDGTYYNVYDPASASRTGKHKWADFDGKVKVFYLIKKTKKATANKTTTSATTSASVAYYKKYTGTFGQIDTVLKAIGVSSKYYGSWQKRKPLAKKNGIDSYTGTAAQNTKLISLAKKGKLKKI